MTDEFSWRPGMRFRWVGRPAASNAPWEPGAPLIVVHASGRYVWWTVDGGAALAGGDADLLRAKVDLLDNATPERLAKHIAHVEYAYGDRPLGQLLPTPGGE